MLPNIFGTYRGLRGGGVQLLSDDPIFGHQLTDPVLTSIVLSSGIVDDADSPRSYLFPEESGPSVLFKARTTKGEELELRDTRRGATALIETVDFRVGERVIELVRRTLAALLDADALLVGAPYSLGSTAAGIAREVVLRDCENEAAQLIVNDATFGANVITIDAGQEWNAGGNMLATINEAASMLFNLGIPKEKLKLALFGNARSAAENEATFLERRQYGPGGATAASLEDVRAYLGIGEVRAFNKVAKTAVESATVTRMYGDDAVLFYPGDTRLSTLLGGTAFGRTFVWGAGSALVPYYIPERTSWAYPFQRWQRVEVLNAATAVKIKNVYAAPA